MKQMLFIVVLLIEKETMRHTSDLNLKGHLSMLGANVCWGLMSPVAKLVFASGISVENII